MSTQAINLTFHGIGQTARALDPGECDVWVSRGQFEGVLDAVIGRDDVRITFDDGNVSDVEVALPALRERGLKGTFFIVAGRLGQLSFVDAGMVRELANAGMSIGCHGMRHKPWRGLDAAALREELVDAKAILEDVIGQPVTSAACPFGAYDRRVLKTLRDVGYTHAYTSDRGIARAADFLQVRTSIGPGHDTGVLEEIEALESSPRRALSRRSKLAVKRWR